MRRDHKTLLPKRPLAWRVAAGAEVEVDRTASKRGSRTVQGAS